MAGKCECGCGLDADYTVQGLTLETRDFVGARVTYKCSSGGGMLRVRARRAELAKGESAASARCELCGAPGRVLVMCDDPRDTAVLCCGCRGPEADDKIRARRADRDASPKFYGTRPAVLPLTLPAGTCYALSENRDHQFRFTAQAKLDPNGVAYSGPCEAVHRYFFNADGAAHASFIDWSTVPVQVQDTQTVTQGGAKYTIVPGSGMLTFTIAGSGHPAYHIFKRSADAPEVSVKCLDCSSPATNGSHCIYCAHALCGAQKRPSGRPYNDRATATAHVNLYTSGSFGAEDRSRNEAALGAERPRVTASTRELAKGHPSTWPSQDGEP